MSNDDLIFLGSGSRGNLAAIRAAQLGPNPLKFT
jgi:pyruvate/2-oxoglutarate dehydrogenase complex dihydrolipoamide dehydrogenase (E3) component